MQQLQAEMPPYMCLDTHDAHVPLRINSNNFTDLLIFHVLSLGQNLTFSKTLVYDQIPTKSMTVSLSLV